MGETEEEIKAQRSIYSRGTFFVKRAIRARQLEHHDQQARACYEAIESGILKLKALIEKVRNGEYISECR